MTTMSVTIDKKVLEAIRAEFRDVEEELAPIKETLKYISKCVKAEIERLDKILEELKGEATDDD